MGKTVFVPLTDELLYEHPERILGPVIPFSQQARRTIVEPTVLKSKAVGLKIKTKVDPAVGGSESYTKQDTTSIHQRGVVR